MDGGPGDEDDRHLDHTVIHSQYSSVHSQHHHHHHHHHDASPQTVVLSSFADYGTVATSDALIADEKGLYFAGNLAGFDQTHPDSYRENPENLGRNTRSDGNTGYTPSLARLDSFDSYGRGTADHDLYDVSPALPQAPLLPPIDFETSLLSATSHAVADDTSVSTSVPAAPAFTSVSSPFSSAPQPPPSLSVTAATHQGLPPASAFPTTPVDPQDFYREFQDTTPRPAAGIAIPTTSTNLTVTPSATPATTPASSLAALQTPPAQAGLNGLNAKHLAQPSQPSLRQQQLQSTLRTPRSVSNPADHSRVPFGGGVSVLGSRGLASASSHTSVKDLTKRFDQITTADASSLSPPSYNGRLRSTSRPGLSSSVTRGRSPGAPFLHPPSSPSSSPAATTSRLKSPDSRREHHPPAPVSSPQSFASRIAKPRTASFGQSSANSSSGGGFVASNDDTPKASMAQLSPRAGRMASPPPSMRANGTGGGLLFGEILAEDSNSYIAGYGISLAQQPRRTSESSMLVPPPVDHPEPISPTDWYRNVVPPQRDASSIGQQHQQQYSHQRVHERPPSAHRTRIPTTTHKRSMSDLSGSKQMQPHSPPPPRSRSSTQNNGSHVRMPSADSVHYNPTSPSRLPVSVKKLTAGSGSTSPASTRSSSPSTTTRRPLTTARTTRQQQAQHSPPSVAANMKAPLKRAATPTSTSSSISSSVTPRAKASYQVPPPPTSPPSTRRQQPPSQIATPSSNGRLNAYISSPPPKLSPPLRSSRPRLPVSSASSNAGNASNAAGARSGRTSAAERGRTYANSTRSSAAKQQEGVDTRRRKIDVGPIDFAQRRETIRLAYSKSIRETEAKAARQAAAERRKKEMEAAARAKALAEAAVRAQSDAGTRAMSTTALPAPTTPSATEAAAAAGGYASISAPTATAATREASAALAAATTAVSSTSTQSAVARPVTPPLPSPTTAAAAIAAATAAMAVSATTPTASPNGHTNSINESQKQLQQPLRISTSVSALQQQHQMVDGRRSPTLGIPGTFPDFGGTPPRPRKDVDDDIPPPSATSQRSIVTEFDNEEQTEPPIQDPIGSPFNHTNGEKAEYRSPFDLSASEDQAKAIETEATQQQFPGFPKAEYHYPFEDDGGAAEIPVMIDQGPVAPQAAQDPEVSQPFGGLCSGSSYQQESNIDNAETARPFTPPPEEQQSGSTYATPMGQLNAGRQLGEKQDPTTEIDAVTPRGDDPTVNPATDNSAALGESGGLLELNHRHSQHQQTSVAVDSNAEERMRFYHTGLAPEYEPQPYQSDSKHTTVTILSRETEHPTPRPPLTRGVTDDASPTTRLGHLEEFYTGPSLRDNVATLRDSAFASSDISDELILPPGSEQPVRTPETSNSLTIPPLLSPANRSSQQSGWTDFSIESADARDYLASRDSVNGTGVYSTNGAFIRIRNGSSSASAAPQRSPYQFDSRPHSMAENDQQQGYNSSSGNSYSFTNSTSNSNNNSNQQLGSNHLDSSVVSPLDKSAPNHVQPVANNNNSLLPEVDTGTNFFIPYLTSEKKAAAASSAVPMLPDHEPPPPPVSSDDRSSFAEGSSAYYDSSRPNSFAQRDDQGSFSYATDDSMILTPPTLTAQSSNQASLDATRQSISGATLVDSETRKSGDVGGSAVAGSTGAAASTKSEKQAPTKEQTRLIQRRMVIRELIDTEAIFVRDMNIVEEIYKGTAEACPKLDDKTVKLIFRNSNEIISFHTAFLSQLKDGVVSVYSPKGGRKSSPLAREGSMRSEAGTVNSTTSAAGTLASNGRSSTNGNPVETEDARDRQTSIGPVFRKNIDQMRIAHEGFLRSSDNAAKRLIQIQEDPTVKVWLSECNEVAKDLTAAWNLDSLLIKPMQRITKYPNLISQLLQYTPADHPDRPALMAARTTLETAILEINKTKKNFELVGQIVGRKRKESDVRAGFARAFGKRVDKLQASSSRPTEDQVYTKLNEKFGDDYLRLQVVLRDVEFYTRQVATYVHEFLQLLSAMELVMRLQPSPYPELESKWARFNVSMRDIEKIALEQHLAQVRKHVIEPFEMVIKCYGNPSLAMKKRAKRRLDYERAVQLKKGGKKVDKQLSDLVEQYEALNEALKRELPMLSAHTEKIGNICIANFVSIQARWLAIWKDKVRVVLEDQYQNTIPEIADIVTTFQREYRDMEDHIKRTLTIINKDSGPSSSGSGSGSGGGGSMLRSLSNKPSDTMTSPRVRGGSVNSDGTPSLPSPEFTKRNSGQFAQFAQFVLSPSSSSANQHQQLQPPNSATSANSGALPSPHQYYFRGDHYGATTNNSAAGGAAGAVTSPVLPAQSFSNQSIGSPGAGSGRPGTGRSYESSNAQRPSIDSNINISSQPGSTHYPPNASMTNALNLNNSRRDSGSTYNSSNAHPNIPDNGTGGGSGRRFSGLFHSALPVNDDERSARAGGAGIITGLDDNSRRSSRASSRERNGNSTTASGYNIMWLAASLFEFNIETKTEAGYPYLTYQAGEIFDVIAEKGELWLAKNQDDPVELVGWIWSKHFAKLADS